MGCTINAGFSVKLIAEVDDIYLYRDAVDFRKSINGLILIVEQEMDIAPFADAMFIFCNKACDKVKILYWDNTGFCLWYKRLEKDKFKWPRTHDLQQMKLSEYQWQQLLSGYNIIGHKPLIFAQCN